MGHTVGRYLSSIFQEVFLSQDSRVTDLKRASLARVTGSVETTCGRRGGKESGIQEKGTAQAGGSRREEGVQGCVPVRVPPSSWS